MGVIFTLILGALVGWVASLITKRDAEMGGLYNVVVGVVGALLGSWLFNGDGTWRITPTFGSVVSALAGAVILCVLINLVTRKRIR